MYVCAKFHASKSSRCGDIAMKKMGAKNSPEQRLAAGAEAQRPPG